MTHPKSGPDAAGANNLFVVEPRGWYAMMSLHAPAMRPKLVDCDPIEVDWQEWLKRLTESLCVSPIGCIEKITAWVASDFQGSGWEPDFNQYANLMLESLSVNNGVRPMGAIIFTGYNAVLDDICGLNADQFATLAASYRRAAQRVSPVLYGRDVEVGG